MYAFPRTHSHVNHISAQPTRENGSFPWPYQEMQYLMERGAGVACPMPAGWGLFFNERTLHSSGENRSDAPRPVVNCAYVPQDEPVILYSPSPEDETLLDVLAMDDITEYHIQHGKPLPYPYPDFLRKIGEVRYWPATFKREHVEPLLRADFVPYEGDAAPFTDSECTWINGGMGGDADATQVEEESIVEEAAPAPQPEPELAAAAVGAAPPAAEKKSWISKLFGRS
jgi:Phytanoyl-CoA dioxygenase (PhyH)